ncbi:lipase 3-like [Danaus plexippus]|uniref:Lipase n=1 Tax=Danaus plexippus plexippus TaxID=278856 RepID=A0A212FCD3_DANPL|nr:lipase 3-like [Danaus plexippus]OWR51392.1 putative lysosomal acid lipase [Danaus plexippus plexippus]
MLAVVLIVTALVTAQAGPSPVLPEDRYLQSENDDRPYDIAQRIARDGYYSESHNVITSDGYILELVRIPYKRFEFWRNPFAPKKPVVFLMHGLQGCAITYITLGAKRSLAYNLAEAGFDVWLGNARGALNSRKHLILDPDNPDHAVKFFDYTFEDIATKDLPAMIDAVLRITKQEKLHYVGHSQGATAFITLNSVKPEYNDKFLSADLLAGVGYQDHFPTKIIDEIAKQTDLIFALARRQGLMEIGHLKKSSIVEDYKNTEEVEAANALNKFLSLLEGILMLGRLEIIAGASIKQYAHFGQNIRDKSFRRYNYGALRNLVRYGSLEPPKYDISRITVDLTMHYAMSDVLLSEEDVLNMARVIPNAKARRVERESFGHMDFVISNDSKELVTDFIVEKLKNSYL